jgi:hypothetical protein
MYSHGKLNFVWDIRWIEKDRCKNHANCEVSNHKVKVPLNSGCTSANEEVLVLLEAKGLSPSIHL